MLTANIAGSVLGIRQEAYVSLRTVVIGICKSYCVVFLVYFQVYFSGNEIRGLSELDFVLTNQHLMLVFEADRYEYTGFKECFA